MGMMHRYTAYGVNFEADFDLALPKSSDLGEQSSSKSGGNVKIVTEGKRPELLIDSQFAGTGIYTKDRKVIFNIPGIVQIVMDTDLKKQINVACSGTPEDLGFFFRRVFCAQILKFLGINRIQGAICEIQGKDILFVGPAGSGKTAAAAAALAGGGAVISDGLACWRKDQRGLMIETSGAVLYCWRDVWEAWLRDRKSHSVRGNTERFAVPVNITRRSMRDFSAVVSISVGNDSQSKLEQIFGIDKLSTLSGCVDQPLEFLANTSSRFFILKRPRVVSATFAPDLEAIINAIASSCAPSLK